MIQPSSARAEPTIDQALQRGRSEGFATAAAALGAVSFFQLLGVEKALLAILLAVIALRGAPTLRARRRSWIALGLGGLYVAIAAATVILFPDKVAELAKLLQSLG